MISILKIRKWHSSIKCTWGLRFFTSANYWIMLYIFVRSLAKTSQRVSELLSGHDFHPHLYIGA